MRKITEDLEIVKSKTRTIKFLGIVLMVKLDVFIKGILFKTYTIKEKTKWEKIWDEVYDHKFTYYITVQDAYNKLCEKYWVNSLISCIRPKNFVKHFHGNW